MIQKGLPQGTLYVAPSPSTSHGISDRSAQVLHTSGAAILQFFLEVDMELLGLGQEPGMKTAVRAKLEHIAPAFGTRL